MGTSAGSSDEKKGRVKQFSVLTVVLASVILIALSAIYPKVDLLAMAKFAVVFAVILTIMINLISGRNKK